MRQQASGSAASLQKGSGGDGDDDEHRGKQARVQAAVGSRSKAMKGLVGCLAEGGNEERARWAEECTPAEAC